MSVTSQGVHLHKLAQLFPAISNLIVDDEVTEIMVTSHPKRGVLVFFEKKGKLYRAPLTTIHKSDVLSFCNAASRPLGSNLKDEPLIDARLADGSRVAIAVPPASPNGPAVTIRRFSKVAYTGLDLVKFGSLPKEVFDLLVHTLTHAGNVLVAGGTGSGKTTLLNALLAEFPEDDRLVVIEDVIELKVDQPNVVRLEARTGADGPLSARRMVKHALRQRPDHIVLGEVRGKEAYDVLQALNTGHGGSMTTIHANSAENALLRLASCALEGTDMPWSIVAANVAMAFDLIVHQERRPDRSRGVSEVIRVKAYDRVREAWDVESVWRYGEAAERTATPAMDETVRSAAAPAAAGVLKLGSVKPEVPCPPVAPLLEEAAAGGAVIPTFGGRAPVRSGPRVPVRPAPSVTAPQQAAASATGAQGAAPEAAPEPPAAVAAVTRDRRAGGLSDGSSSGSSVRAGRQPRSSRRPAVPAAGSVPGVSRAAPPGLSALRPPAGRPAGAVDDPVNGEAVSRKRPLVPGPESGSSRL